MTCLLKILLLCIISVSATSCGFFSSLYQQAEKGSKVWCNKRYLHEMPPNFDHRDKEVAKEGYMYALAGALVLQKNSSIDNDHYFEKPERLVSVDEPDRKESGFEVKTYKLFATNKREKLKEIIIAYAGSNDSADWMWANLFNSKKQYNQARAYALEVIDKHKDEIVGDVKVVVTGYSLGGGLSIHVAKTLPEEKIDKVWVFNPSPKTHSNSSYDKRIWMASAKGEALEKIRTPLFLLWPGIYKIGASWDQSSSEFDLVKSNRIYGHYRWVLARQMLHVADLALYEEKKSNSSIDPSLIVTEPLSILEKSRFSACKDIEVGK